MMDVQLVNRLNALNREFYAQFAESFSASRSVERTNLDPIMPYLSDGVKVLDVGCGNGRLLARLDRERLHLDYVGLDVTAALVEIARSHRPHLRHINAEFHVADITARDWIESVRERAPFDVVLMMAVLHHVPGFALRCAVMRDIHALLRSGGILLMSNWQFTRNERLRKKIVPWQTLGIDEQELEAGDVLLDWKRGGTGYRYCHLITEADVQALAAQSGFQVVEQFDADADLNLFSVLRRTS